MAKAPRIWPFRRAILAVFAALAFAMALGAPGCAAQFDPPSKVDAVRILAVRADKPYASPGDNVTFDMTYVNDLPLADGGTAAKVEIVWFGGCFDPEGDEYFACYSQLGKVFAGLTSGNPIPGLIGEGPSFTMQLPTDIISRRPAPQTGPRYGIAYVFFAACAGKIGPLAPGATSTSTSLPVGCFDDDGNQLDADSFVPGYTQVYAFDDGRTNANPAPDSLNIKDHNATGDGAPLPSGDTYLPVAEGDFLFDTASADVLIDEVMSADAGPDATLGAGGGGGAGGSGADASPYTHVVECAATDDERKAPPGSSNSSGCGMKSVLSQCTTYDIKLIIKANVAEIDPAATNPDGTMLHEAVWVDYYADGGDFKSEIELVSASDTGYADDHASEWIPPNTPGLVSIWAVVHDSRGGTGVIQRYVIVD